MINKISLIITCLTLLINNNAISQLKNNDCIISFQDYKLFVNYVRDSITRELLSKQLLDFCNETNTEEISWETKINYADEEIVDIISYYCDYREHSYLYTVINNKLVVENNKLVYRYSNDTVLVLPNMEEISKNKNIELDIMLSVDDSWNENIDTLNICPYLSKKQLIAYNKWSKNIDIKKVKRLLKNKSIPKVQNIPCDSTYNWRTKLHRRIYRRNNGTFEIHEFDDNKKVYIIGYYSSIYPEIKNGTFKFFYPSGKLFAKGFYYNNIPTNTWTIFNDSGAISETINYTDVISILVGDTIQEIEIENVEDAEEPPVFRNDNYKSFEEYIHSSIIIPPIFKYEKSMIERESIAEFVINNKGKLRNIKIIKGDNIEYNIELTRVLLNSPNWIPARKSEKNINVRMYFKIVY